MIGLVPTTRRPIIIDNYAYMTRTQQVTCELEYFQEKCIAVFRPEMRENKGLEHFSVSEKH